MPLKHIDYLFRDNRYSMHKCLFKSSDWLLDEIEDLEKEYGEQIWTPGSIMMARQWNGSDGLTKILVPGNLYMFVYDPLLKYILPYYDIFPLVLVFESGDGWFRGLNFHHLPYQARIRLLGHLMNYATTISPYTGKPILNDQTRLLFDWPAVEDSPARPLVRPIEQKYWMNHAITDFKYINPLHWALMMMLPCEHFVKESNRNKVWDDTVRKAMQITEEHLKREDPTVDFEKVMQKALSSVKQRDRRAITQKLEEV